MNENTQGQAGVLGDTVNALGKSGALDTLSGYAMAHALIWAAGALFSFFMSCLPLLTFAAFLVVFPFVMIYELVTGTEIFKSMTFEYRVIFFCGGVYSILYYAYLLAPPSAPAEFTPPSKPVVLTGAARVKSVQDRNEEMSKMFWDKALKDYAAGRPMEAPPFVRNDEQIAKFYWEKAKKEQAEIWAQDL
jgi:hypothetical protein